MISEYDHTATVEDLLQVLTRSNIKQQDHLLEQFVASLLASSTLLQARPFLGRDNYLLFTSVHERQGIGILFILKRLFPVIPHYYNDAAA